MRKLKRRQRNLIIICAALALLLAVFGPAAWSALRYVGAGVYEANWGLAMPDGIKELYRTDSGASFHGDGYRYAVYDYPEPDEEFDSLLNAGADEYIGERFSEIADELGVPEGERPDLGADFSWRVGRRPADERDKLYIISQGGKLYVAELFM